MIKISLCHNSFSLADDENAGSQFHPDIVSPSSNRQSDGRRRTCAAPSHT